MKRQRYFTGILASLILLGIWVIMSLTVSGGIIPTPIAVAKAFTMKSFAPNFLVSMGRVVVSLTLAILIAVPLGLFLGQSPRWDKWIAPLIFLTYPIPKIVFLPIFFILLGIGNISKVALIALVVFYQILVTTRDGSRSVKKPFIDALVTLGGSTLDIYRHVVIPACLPAILTSLRISIGTSVAILFFVESFATRNGLGNLILDAWGMADYPMMFVGIIGMSVLGIFLYEIVEIMERRLCKWAQL
ncbi:MAG: ABC transporter permease [Deltaproteobacteria bacterium]|nr:MAG: ABC transporter permease [Deltaproteobacteria bacterium]